MIRTDQKLMKVAFTNFRGPVLRCALLSVALLQASCSHLAVTPTQPDHATNVILFLGDGMGISTVTAARIFDGQSRGQPGEENYLSFERFPNVALVKTYNSNQQVPDSAGTATAIHTGVKTRAGVVSVGPDVRRGNCIEARESRLKTIGEIAKERALAVGIVTTSRVTDASPATLYAHLPERDWESDRYITDEEHRLGCVDIAMQLVSLGADVGPDIVLGGGLREFLGSEFGGRRKKDGEDLVANWLLEDQRQFVDSRDELARLEADNQVLGLFSLAQMTYVVNRGDDTSEPTLAEMTAAAIDYLDAQGNGYYLFVEGGLIDKAHHVGRAGFALAETRALADAVRVTMDKVDLNRTLIIVTADHSNTLTIGGYPTRGNPILGYETTNDGEGEPNTAPTLAADGMPYTTLGYINGPGAVIDGPREMPESGITSTVQALVPLATPKKYWKPSSSGTHAGEDVAIYAIGPGAGRVSGVMEQERIFDIIVSALGW